MIEYLEPGELADCLSRQGFALDPEPLEYLARYLDLLMRWNKVMNLVGARTWQDAVERLVVDSFHLAAFLESLPVADAPLCWDLGAGAGIPGIPLRLLWQRGEYWMVEARDKRALFLYTALARHPLGNTRVYRGRLERFFTTPQGRDADVILSRAFMPWQDLLATIAGRLRPGGTVIFLLNTPPDLQLLKPTSGEPAWSLRKSSRYSVRNQVRYICAVQQL